MNLLPTQEALKKVNSHFREVKRELHRRGIRGQLHETPLHEIILAAHDALAEHPDFQVTREFNEIY